MKYSVLFRFLSLACAALFLACNNNNILSQDVPVNLLPTQPFPMDRAASAGKIPAFNEAQLDSTLTIFLAQFMTIVERHQLDRLLEIVDNNIHYAFDEEGGKEGFVRFWHLDSAAETSALWETLMDVLRMRGGFYGSGMTLFVAPYYFVVWPQEYSPENHGVALGDSIPLLDSPSEKRQAVAALNFDIVKYTGNHGGEEFPAESGRYPWYEVETLAGGTGWVEGKYLGSPVGYRVGIRRINNAWRVAFFVAGN